MPPEHPTDDDPLRHIFDADGAEQSQPLSRREARRRARASAPEPDTSADETRAGDSAASEEWEPGDTSDDSGPEPAGSAASASDSSASAEDPGSRDPDAAEGGVSGERPEPDAPESARDPNDVTAAFDLLVADAGDHADRSRRRRATAPATERRRRSGKPVLWTVITVIVIGAVVASGIYVWNTFEPQIKAVMGWQEPIDYEGDGSGETYIVISEGDTGTDIAHTLADSGVTKTSEAFYSLLLEQHPEPTFQPGTYQLKKKMSAQAALDALMDPASRIERTALIREGLTGESILQILSDSTEIPLDDFRSAVEDPTAYGVPETAPSIEGWLFPALYTFGPDDTAEDIIQTLVDRTVQALDDAGVAAEDRERVLTIASIVQREARQEDDFYKVSRVIQNRLDQDMLLQMDSTAQYGVDAGTDSVWSSKEALESDNPWNTYKRKGLPVGPISNPGDLAIDAASHPADGDWLYFVTVDLSTGETVFSNTHAEHEKAVEQLRQWCRDNPDQGC